MTEAVTPPPADVTRQLSYSGTPRGPDGTTTPDDYARDMMQPTRRMEIFEEMGNDQAVATAIDSRRQEINAANWALSTASEAPNAQEILEFVEDNLYPVLDDLIRWLGGGALQYGFGAVEPVYQWADRPVADVISRGKVNRPTKTDRGRRLYLAKIAHLRQRSVDTFKISPTGDLESAVQYSFNGQTFRRVEIPAEKLLLWTYNRQGDDYWGVPPARHCFKGWSFKSQVEKLNLLHLDRFGVGLPVVEEGEGWNQVERDRMAAFLASWRSGGGNFLMHPAGGAIQVVSDDGKTTLSMLEWVKYYDLAIAKTYLTQQTELGSTNTGARAVGETMLEQLGGIVQADCEDLGTIINQRLVKRLVDWNYGPQDAYPQFTPSQRVKIGGGIATMLTTLIGSNAIHPRPEDEAFLRDAFGLPEVEIDTLQAEQEERDAAADALRESLPDGGDGDDPEDKGDKGKPPKPGEKKAKRPVKLTREPHVHTHHLSALTLADGAPVPAVPGTSYRTVEFAEWEQRILRPDVLGRDLDLASERLVGEVKDVLSEIDTDLEAQARALASRGAEQLAAAVRTIAVPERLRKKLRAVLLEAAKRSREYGHKSVLNEIARQMGPAGIGPQRTPAPSLLSRLAQSIKQLAAGDERTDEEKARDLHLAGEVDRAVEEEVQRRESAARSAILTALSQAGGATTDILQRVVGAAAAAALIGLSTGRSRGNVEGVVNVGFGVGRGDAAAAITSGAGGAGNRSGLVDDQGNPIELVAKVYSAVMDLATCDECAKWDGAEFPIDYPEDYTGVQAPNPRCFGTIKRCRCIWVYVTSLESVPLVPAAKGPEPIRGAA